MQPTGGDPTWYLVLDLAGTWLAALGTLAAVGVAVGVAVREHRARQAADERARIAEAHEVQEFRRREERSERAQASRVTVRHEDGTQHFLVRNDSDLPIFGAMVHIHGPSRFAATAQADTIEPSAARELGIWNWDQDALDATTFALVFRDANDAVWLRLDDGSLHRAPEDRVEARNFLRQRLENWWAADREGRTPPDWTIDPLGPTASLEPPIPIF